MYFIAKRDDAWRAFDLEIEGVSIKKSYGAQYNDFLRGKSFDELLVTMKKKIDDAKKKEAERNA